MANFDPIKKDFASPDSPGESVLHAGDVRIEEISIISSLGMIFEIPQFLAELNLYEDMFRSGLYGNVLVIDALNLAETVPLRGEEFLRLKIRTPSMKAQIYKTFRIYAVTDRRMLGEPNKQSYVLHFCSPEIYIDMLSPIWKSYKGKISDVVADIYKTHLQTSRNGESGDETPLIILGETANSVKYISPGWTPSQNINWLATRSIGDGYKNPGYLFFESNKAFYFANTEAIIEQTVQTKGIYNNYVYTPQNIGYKDPAVTRDGLDYVKNVDIEYKKIESLEILETLNHLKATQAGYFANRIFTVDVIKKDYAIFDYDHVGNYNDYAHLENIGNLPNPQIMPMSPATARNPAAAAAFYPKNIGLFDDQENNISEVIQDVLTRRRSTLSEYDNLKLLITVPGRTDAEVGNVIYLNYPNIKPRSEEDGSLGNQDPMFSGFYLVTAIRHKFTLLNHTMTMEIVKDSVQRPLGGLRNN
jgi:hypothetical protein